LKCTNVRRASPLFLRCIYAKSCRRIEPGTYLSAFKCLPFSCATPLTSQAAFSNEQSFLYCSTYLFCHWSLLLYSSGCFLYSAGCLAYLFYKWVCCSSIPRGVFSTALAALLTFFTTGSAAPLLLEVFSLQCWLPCLPFLLLELGPLLLGVFSLQFWLPCLPFLQMALLLLYSTGCFLYNAGCLAYLFFYNWVMLLLYSTGCFLYNAGCIA